MQMNRLRKAPSFLLLSLVIVLNLEPFDCRLSSEDASDNSGAICSQGSSPKDSILCIGKLKDRIIVLTNPDKAGDQIVYELPASSLNSSIDKLMMTTDTVTVKDKWPTLYKYNGYIALVNKYPSSIYNSFVVTDSDSEYLFLTTKGNQSEGVLYDMKSNVPDRGLFYGGSDDQVQISSSDVNKFYAIHKVGSGLKIMQYSFKEKTVKASVKNGLPALQPAQAGKFYSMDKGDNDTITVSTGKDEKSSTLDWPVMKGFVTDKKFYLFGKEHIYIFPESVYDTKGVPVHFTTVPYADFIQCSGDVHNIGNSGSKVGIIIAIVLIILILLLCCLLWCIREAMGKKKHHHKKSSLKDHSTARVPTGDRSQRRISQGKSFKSIRSRGLKGPGNLSARMASNKQRTSANASMQATGRSGMGRSAQANSISKRAVLDSKQSRHINATSRGQSVRTRRSGLHSKK